MSSSGTKSSESETLVNNQPIKPPPSTCSVCSVPSEKWCSGCKKTSYCDTAHQKSHWKAHKKDCFPAALKQDGVQGRYFVASKDIPEGCLIMKESPIVFGPQRTERAASGTDPDAEPVIHQPPICLGCCKLVQSVHKCSTCKWPVCGIQCEQEPAHSTNECKIFSANKILPTGFRGEYHYICLVRTLLLSVTAPESWNIVMGLESHAEARRATNNAYLRGCRADLVDFIQNKCRMHQFDEETIHNVDAAFRINCFGESDDNFNKSLMTFLFDKMSMFSHNCIPNARWVQQRSSVTSKGLTMSMYSAVPIKAGEIISIMYTDTHKGTWQRRDLLKRHRYFECTCARCSDPTELGTFVSALKCVRCDVGYLLPVSSLDLNTDWKCTDCTMGKKSQREVNLILDGIDRQMCDVDDDESAKCVQEMEIILNKNAGITVHPNHWMLTKTKYDLIQRLANIMIRGADNPEFQKQLQNIRTQMRQYTQDCLKLADILVPGLNKYRGSLLFLLYRSIQHRLVEVMAFPAKDRSEADVQLINEFKKVGPEARTILSLEPEGTRERKMLGELEMLFTSK